MVQQQIQQQQIQQQQYFFLDTLFFNWSNQKKVIVSLGRQVQVKI